MYVSTAMHDFNSLALRRPKTPTRMRGNRSFGVYDLHRDFAMRRTDQCSSLRIRAAWRSCDPAQHQRVVFEVRTEIANVCQQMADKAGEPPVD